MPVPMPRISCSQRWTPQPANFICRKSEKSCYPTPSVLLLVCPIRWLKVFRATLEETIQADLLLHVVDAASPMRDKHIDEVNKVLNEIGAADVPQILVMNKIDLCSSLPGIDRDEYDKITGIRLSAKTGLGINTLREALTEAKMHFMQPLSDSAQTNIINDEYHPELD
jgi:GTP-binding protein HflX (EC 3.1.5.-)